MLKNVWLVMQFSSARQLSQKDICIGSYRPQATFIKEE